MRLCWSKPTSFTCFIREYNFRIPHWRQSTSFRLSNKVQIISICNGEQVGMNDGGIFLKEELPAFRLIVISPSQLLWSSRQCAGLLDLRPLYKLQDRHLQRTKYDKNISQATSSQQILVKTFLKNVSFELYFKLQAPRHLC